LDIRKATDGCYGNPMNYLERETERERERQRETERDRERQRDRKDMFQP
jgi:RNA binding exosome subunit